KRRGGEAARADDGQRDRRRSRGSLPCERARAWLWCRATGRTPRASSSSRRAMSSPECDTCAPCARIRDLVLLFPTTQFLIFFCIVFALHWTLNRFPTLDKLTLLAASWVFYAAWNPWFVFLLMTSASISWTAGLALAYAESGPSRRLITAAAVSAHLG